MKRILILGVLISTLFSVSLAHAQRGKWLQVSNPDGVKEWQDFSCPDHNQCRLRLYGNGDAWAILSVPGHPEIIEVTGALVVGKSLRKEHGCRFVADKSKEGLDQPCPKVSPFQTYYVSGRSPANLPAEVAPIFERLFQTPFSPETAGSKSVAKPQGIVAKK